jgi:hypothetical protein
MEGYIWAWRQVQTSSLPWKVIAGLGDRFRPVLYHGRLWIGLGDLFRPHFSPKTDWM